MTPILLQQLEMQKLFAFYCILFQSKTFQLLQHFTKEGIDNWNFVGISSGKTPS